MSPSLLPNNFTFIDMCEGACSQDSSVTKVSRYTSAPQLGCLPEHVIAVTVHAGIGLIAALPAAESALSIEPAGFRSSLANFSAGQSCLHPLHHFMPFSARLFSLAFLFASFFERPALTM